MGMEESPQTVSNLLEEGESVLWSGCPAALPYVLGGMVVTVPLGLVAVASALSWTRNEEIASLPLWSHAVLAVVLIFAAHVLVLRPLLGLHIARRTSYAITDRRALVVCDAFGGRVQQLAHDQGQLTAINGPRNFGKIQFGRSASSSIDVLLFGRAAIPGFYGLPNLEQPLAVLRELREVA